jgi:hypothetical protein
MNSTPQERQFSVNQRVRYKNDHCGRPATGRVTGTWEHFGDKFHPAQPGVDVTMDSQYSPRPVPVRYHIFETSFRPLPADYLDDSEAMTEIAGIMTHIPEDFDGTAEMLAGVLAILRRNLRITDDEDDS